MPRTILMSKGKEKVKWSVMPVTQDSSDERREASSPERTSAAMPGLIAQRAYQLYLEGGCREGRALDDWLAAERDIFGDTNRV